MSALMVCLYDESTASRCLDLIARRAPEFMRIGGGALTDDNPDYRKALTAEERAEIVALGKTAGSVGEIVEETGYSKTTIARVLKAAGVPAPRDRKHEEKAKKIEAMLRDENRRPQTEIAAAVGASQWAVSRISQKLFGKSSHNRRFAA